jgi:hypothetical protein
MQCVQCVKCVQYLQCFHYFVQPCIWGKRLYVVVLSSAAIAIGKFN